MSDDEITLSPVFDSSPHTHGNPLDRPTGYLSIALDFGDNLHGLTLCSVPGCRLGQYGETETRHGVPIIGTFQARSDKCWYHMNGKEPPANCPLKLEPVLFASDVTAAISCGLCGHILHAECCDVLTNDVECGCPRAP